MSFCIRIRRGSTTYGQEFGNIIQQNYPGDDYKDLMAGVDELLRRGVLNPEALGVTGGSVGGGAPGPRETTDAGL